MPYLLKVDAKYDTDKKIHIISNLNDLVSNYPYVMENIFFGKFIATVQDGKIITDFRRPFNRHN